MNYLSREKILKEYQSGRISCRQACDMLNLSIRQFRRVVARYREKGIAGLEHGNRGRTPPNRIDPNIRETILHLAKTTYLDYNDSRLCEILSQEPYRINVSRSTIRNIRRSNGLESTYKR
jgi:transposase